MEWALRFGIAVTNPPDRRRIMLFANDALNDKLKRSYTPSCTITGDHQRTDEKSFHVSVVFQMSPILPRR